jgi:dihydrofolate synthase / folylpolyglutamate synthase
VHVAGTNGKGSTVATVRAIAEAAGLRAHVYTSPHLVRFNERIRVAGTLISDEALVPILEEVERVNAGAPITFFEVTTAAAFLAFARTPADLVVLEVGLGGRLDATNLVNRPAVSCITPISVDHVQYLGDTLVKIAGEKAGIMKRGVPVVIGPQPREVLDVLHAHAKTSGAAPFEIGVDWRVTPTKGGGFRYEGKSSLDLPPPRLPGRHQIDNSGMAIAAAEHLREAGIGIPDQALRHGVANVDWPARLQRLSKGPLLKLLRPGSELYLDGGHNEGGAAVIADWAKAQSDGKPLDVVCGMLSTKSPDAFLARLAPHVRRFCAITVPGAELMLPAEAIAEAARKAGLRDITVAADYNEGVAALAHRAEAPHRLLICGSLAMLCGAVLSENS